jgi:predicted membrane channel-forming protein YqfA (hemolysin III family)
MSDKITAPWVVPVMFVLLGLGVLMILLNYMDLLPGGTDNWYLLGGLGLILGGILTATQLR